MKETLYTPEQLSLLQQHSDKERDFIYETILGILEPGKPSPLKSIEALELQRKTQAEEMMKLITEHLEYSHKSFVHACTPLEKEHFKNIYLKIKSQIDKFVGADSTDESVSHEDCEFLEGIAKRQLVNHHYKAASSMFQFIVILNPFFSGAWVGWAISEYEKKHFDIVDQIYQMAGELLPYDGFLALFASDFYILRHQNDKATAFLERTKEQLIAEGMQDSVSFKEIEKTLLEIKHHR